MGRPLIHQYPVPKYEGSIEKWTLDLEIWLERLQTDSDNAAQSMGGSIRLAAVGTLPIENMEISAYFVDETTRAIDVTCEIADGTALNAAVPRLAADEKFFVSDYTGGWRSVTVFQATGAC